MKWIYILTIVLVFSGCDLLTSESEKAKKAEQERALFMKKVQQSKEIQLKKLSAQTQKDLAILQSKKELAEIEKAKELEKLHLQAELEKEKILLQNKNKQLAFEQKMQEKEREDAMELKRYMMLILGILVMVGAFFIYYYFKKKRENELLAYNDNLQKYFYQKENEARVKIAEKMLDAISSGKLDKEQENQLITAFSGSAKGNYQKQLSSKEEDIIESETLK